MDTINIIIYIINNNINCRIFFAANELMQDNVNFNPFIV